MAIRDLLADDHTLVREGIRMCLEALGDIAVVGEAADGQAAVEQALALEPDVVLMDISMPVLSGIEATARIKKERPTVQVVGLSMYDNEEYVTRLLQAGASGSASRRSATSRSSARPRTVGRRSSRRSASSQTSS